MVSILLPFFGMADFNISGNGDYYGGFHLGFSARRRWTSIIFAN